MSLDVNRLEKVRDLGRGEVQARCPACAEGGADRTGEHLRIYPDGRFGCCVHPKDKGHRSRIFALAGDNTARRFTVRVAKSEQPKQTQVSVKELLQSSFGTLGTPVSNPHAYAQARNNYVEVQKDIEAPVPSVPAEERMPYLLADGLLVIPFNSPDRFHWWKGGQAVKETREEMREVVG